MNPCLLEHQNEVNGVTYCHSTTFFCQLLEVSPKLSFILIHSKEKPSHFSPSVCRFFYGLESLLRLKLFLVCFQSGKHFQSCFYQRPLLCLSSLYLCSGCNISDHKIQVCKNVRTYISITDSSLSWRPHSTWWQNWNKSFQVSSVHSGVFLLPSHLDPGDLAEMDRTSGRGRGSSGPWFSSVHAGIVCFCPRSLELPIVSVSPCWHPCRGSWVPIWPLISGQRWHLLLGSSSQDEEASVSLPASVRYLIRLRQLWPLLGSQRLRTTCHAEIPSCGLLH